MLCGSIAKDSTGGDKFILGSRWWETAIGSGADMGTSVGGDCVKEEDGLGIMVFSFRRMASSLKSMEAWVTTKQSCMATSLAMTTSRWSKMMEEGSASAIGRQILDGLKQWLMR